MDFGKQCRRNHFQSFEPGFIPLNHGSFGAAPKQVLEARQAILQNWQKQKDRFYFDKLDGGIDESAASISKVVNCKPENVCIVDNATTGAAIVAEKLRLDLAQGRMKDRAVILVHSVIYDAVLNTFKRFFDNLGDRVCLETVDIPFPVKSQQELLQAYEDKLKDLVGKPIVMAIVDHISSIPSIVFPLEELCKLLRTHGVEEIFVDGAHALGMVPIDLQQIDCDYYVSNAHKWLFCPNSCAFFYFRDLEKGAPGGCLHHPITSHNLNKGLKMESHWVGTRDYSPMLCVGSAINFVDKMGGLKKIMAYNHELVWRAGVYFSKSFGTRLGAPEDMVGSLCTVELPGSLIDLFEQDLDLRRHIRETSNIECFPFYTLEKGKTQKTCWIRLSSQIYNSFSDYEVLHAVLNKIIAKAT
uniref:Aminotransferase class V domain-containing protein n=1 Tax=Mucochytrium quahogii TaxID=96639 RepID=A0A7S2S7P5_9STRA|mmetsp:Transcript_633/g.1086  ORF Transcript_633/g.1086 Transcript_633/m.1086 type:complete len:413 (+) Transcript_633:56-1294(+)